MEAYWHAFEAWATPIGDAFLNFMDPDGLYKASAIASWPLGDFASALAIALLYVAAIIFGSAIMLLGFPAVNTRMLQFVYNPIQIMLCSYMCIEAGVQAYRHHYSFYPCNPYDATNPVMGRLLWLFYMSKILDFVDTFIIIVGKKWKQLSFLHVYHHLSVFLVYWFLFRVCYDGEIYLTILLNGGIHTIMYTYYFVSSHTSSIWWKQYLTMLQLVQFAIMNVQGYLVIANACPKIPFRVQVTYMLYVQSLFWLFVFFFAKTYCGGKPRAKMD
ncbi:hypothetical protein SPRG_09463 [Saprolegnia parasitica CBS 223.65]|uniref:Elongation of fatty acids protein n=1 Tax=Saprolegnia parasitica (strain CBS 223.65) TaxID=695850 RepID=A0A067C7U7_SAPPC|nr:hypothetical protein SPRG_09463 [Saprolegnia parasitica CBS 223.65]KDO25200.1 hypothetical protein SPRG_09463 [Saprolegnia parasitica CBS 223.65]|eukprot:XP_012204051.1 hypothetical protein SPRG_09463 [Saprolegnia parasitica CBS 223.65]